MTLRSVAKRKAGAQALLDKLIVFDIMAANHP
jgi:hypothetical protein